MTNQKQTSRRVATLAATVLANPKATKKAKELAASALSQARTSAGSLRSACSRRSKTR